MFREEEDYPDDRGSKFLRNVGICLPGYVALNGSM
jgi:hypothetical protein